MLRSGPGGKRGSASSRAAASQRVFEHMHLRQSSEEPRAPKTHLGATTSQQPLPGIIPLLQCGTGVHLELVLWCVFKSPVVLVVSDCLGAALGISPVLCRESESAIAGSRA